MSRIAFILRFLAKLKFKILGHATIKDIPTEKFNELIGELISKGWRKSYEYDNYDAWIDYGCMHLRRKLSLLKFEWDNWSEGSIEGPRLLIEAIAKDYGFVVTHEWRWSEYDKSQSSV